MPDRPAVEVLLEHARAGMDRVHTKQLATEVANGAIMIDIRPVESVRRTVSCPQRSSSTATARVAAGPHLAAPRTTDIDQQTRLIVVCEESYSSSLAAANLRELGPASHRPGRRLPGPARPEEVLTNLYR